MVCKRPCGILVILSLSLMLAACSAIKLSYGNAQALSYWWLDRYLDFDAEQEELMRTELAELHAWHRVHELPSYIRLLRQMEALAVTEVESVTVCEVVEQVRSHMAQLNARLAPIALRLGPTLQPAQLARLEKKFAERNEEWREDWLEGTLEQRQEFRLEASLKRAQHFYGRLTDEQIELIRSNIAASGFKPEISYREILQRQQDALRLLDSLRTHALSGDAAAQQVSAYFARLMQSPDAAYRDHLRMLTNESCQGIAMLHNATTPRQRQRAAAKLQRYAQDLAQLHQQSAAASGTAILDSGGRSMLQP